MDRTSSIACQIWLNHLGYIEASAENIDVFVACLIGHKAGSHRTIAVDPSQKRIGHRCGDYYVFDNNKCSFIETIIDDIHWDKTISLFQNINSLHILFYEKKKSGAKTKKIYIHKPSRKKTRKKLNE